MIKISIIIISFNTQDLIINLLQSLKKAIEVGQNQGYQIETLVIDNNSQDESTALIKQKFPWVNLTKNKRNIGFAAGSNLGIIRSKGELILLLNSDTVVSPDTLQKTIKFMDDYPQAGALTCRVELSDGKIDPASHRGFPDPWNAFCYFSGLEKLFPKIKIFGGYHQAWKNLNQIHEIDACAGSFFLVRKSVIDKVGLLDERFFMYGEDLDWAYRIKKAGYKSYYYPETKIVHFKRRSGIKKVHDGLINKDLAAEIKMATRRNFFATMKLFYEKHYQKKYPKILRQFILVGIWLISKFRK